MKPRFDPWVGKIPWKREWQPTLVLLPGEFHGQRSLVGYSPWGREELDNWASKHTRKHVVGPDEDESSGLEQWIWGVFQRKILVDCSNNFCYFITFKIMISE